jgi:hypothetical protein
VSLPPPGIWYLTCFFNVPCEEKHLDVTLSFVMDMSNRDHIGKRREEDDDALMLLILPWAILDVVKENCGIHQH